jgi:hypothetical protein
VSHGTGAVIDEMKAAGYKPLVENGCVSPSLPGIVGYGDMANVNRGIGGDGVAIWIKYEQLPVTSDRKVLVDLVAAHWPNWQVQCPAGFQEASGDARLTLNTKPACNRNGLCVKYAPLNTTEDATIVTALMLTRANDKNYLCGGGQCVGNTGVTSLNVGGIDVHTNCGGEIDGERAWVYFCRNAERRAASAKTFGSVTAEEKLRLLKTYAPRIYLATDESFFPSDVEHAFKYMTRYQNSDGKYWLKTKQSFDLNTTLEYWSGFSDVGRAPVYAYWIDKSGAPDGSYVDLVYFTYYPYNLGKKQAGVFWGNHVSDWEHATVRLRWTQSNGSWALVPIAVYMPYHDGGNMVEWNKISKTETHPILFAASGSHGLWPNAGSHPYKTQLENAIVLYDETSQGKVWDTWNRLIAWDSVLQKPLTGEPWPKWMSKKYSYAGDGDPTRPEAGPIFRWGNAGQVCPPLGFCRLEDGPTGPPDKDVWRSDVFQ